MRRPIVDPQFGPTLERLRKQANLSLQELADKMWSSKTQIQGYEKGTRVPASIEIIKQLEVAVGAPGELTALVVYEPGVPRRAVVGSMTALAAGHASQAVALEALRQGLRHAVRPDGDHWQQVANQYSRSYYDMAPAVVYDRLVVDVTVIQHQLVACPEDRDLLRAAAQLSLMLAITLNAVGQTWPARRWWDTARDLADQSGDLGVRIMARSQDAVKGLYDGRPLASVLELTEETVALAGGRVCPGTAGVLAGRAQALALAGRVGEAEAAVRAVQDITEAMPAPHLADESVWGWPEHRLHHTMSWTYTEIGRTDLAWAAQERALEIYPPHHAGNRAMVQMHRAACLIKDRHVSDGLRCAADAFDALPADRHNQLLYEVFRRAVSAVPAKEQRRGDFDDVRQRLVNLRQRLTAAG